ncbi:hypothetical protein RRG08_029209 [Elysia crispata]|uniref:Uncharacterized protein n=1 Tax=Elysia crispata TaxID=231223 RepID=A0AAE1DZJ3_9GAST|nr:hypothetical protein RRG08_029209 [Elysia crispata]
MEVPKAINYESRWVDSLPHSQPDSACTVKTQCKLFNVWTFVFLQNELEESTMPKTRARSLSVKVSALSSSFLPLIGSDIPSPSPLPRPSYRREARPFLITPSGGEEDPHTSFISQAFPSARFLY